MFVFLISLWNFGKNSIFLASAGSFNVKNDNFQFFFRCLRCKCWICRLCSKTKIHGLDRFHGNGPYCKSLTEKEPMRAQGLGLPYNNSAYLLHSRSALQDVMVQFVSISFVTTFIKWWRGLKKFFVQWIFPFYRL